MTTSATKIAVNGDETVQTLSADVDETEVKKLRDRWELASVFNFLNVFEPLIGRGVTAEEIEAALIRPNAVLAKLHIALLRGIPPVSKKLNNSDSWITSLCSKVAMWWPWVAEGELPLRAAKGMEIQRYKELDPTTRLLILKALCEIRAEQYDAVAYINDALKDKAPISAIRKDKIGEDSNGASYWYEGNAIIGHRLYREVTKTDSRVKSTGRDYIPDVGTWETIATNLEEFRKVADKLSSSRAGADVAVAKSIEGGAIAILERIQQNQEYALKRKQRQEMLLTNPPKRISTVITRSCRNRKPVSYTSDHYDQTINEALQQLKATSTTEEKSPESNHVKLEQVIVVSSTQLVDIEKNSKGSLGDRNGVIDSNTKSNKPDVVDNNDEYSNLDEETENDNDSDDDLDKNLSVSDETNNRSVNPRNPGEYDAQGHARVRFSKRIAGLATHHVGRKLSPETKKRLRQRPLQNSALNSADDS